ncbi:MAG: tetratricopeptide repeat protein [Candidatus Zixiibacteriota bacterium]|nr:MAG: tetratricopeptide repeat protein [candidate division Zixibacteria bacterium]
MRKTKLFFLASALTVLVVIAVWPGQAAAFGSKEKSPQERLADNKRQAVKQYNDGVKHMKKARRKAEAADSLFAYNYRATSDAKAREEYRKAVKNFTRAIEYDSTLAEAFNNLGYCYRKLGDLKKSLEAYSQAIALKSDFAQAYEYRGEAYLAMGDLAKATRDHDTLKRLKSPYADTLARAIELFRLTEIKNRLQPENH